MSAFLHQAIAAVALTALSSTALAGRYPVTGVQAFTYADGTTSLGDGTSLTSSFLGTFARISANALQLAHATFSGNATAFRIPQLDSGSAIQSMDVSVNVKMQKSSATAQGGPGWALCFGAVPASGNGSGDLGFGMTGGMVVSFDTYSVAGDLPSIEVYCSNVSVGSFPASALLETTPIGGGTFTLTNPSTGGTTAAISYVASPATVQTAMRAVSGWSSVVVTGTAGNWTVTMGASGQYASPTGNGAALTGNFLTPGQGQVVVTNTQDGTDTLPEVWTLSLQGRGFIFDTSFRSVLLHWDYDGLDLTYGGQTVFTDMPTPGFAPASGNTFAFTAGGSSGGAQYTIIDDLLITTQAAAPPDTGGPVISEFMTENKETLEDEDMDSPDWLEIYNGQNASVNLNGYQLTNGSVTWVFPSVSVPAYGHLLVYASGKNRTANPALLHTSFTLPKAGGVVSLLNPGGAVISTWNYPAQVEDVSYGLKYQGGASGFVSPSSPGAATLYSYSVAPNGPSEEPVWSRPGGIITSSTAVSIAPPVAPGAVIRYTTDNTIPTSGSPVFPGSVNVTASTNLRARVFTPGYLPGPVSSRTFLLIDSSLSNYNASGQPFKTHLPLIVFDSFGVNVDAVSDSAQPRPHRYTYAVVVDKDVTGYADITSPSADFQGRGGTHVRGDSSGGFAQKSYAWETWDNDNNDKEASILGMPAESDWALHGPYTDKTFIRNFLTYSKMRELHGGINGRAMRTKLVEVIYNQDANQPVSYSDYRGVYVLMERIKRGSDRVDIAKLNNLATDPALITGGYIFRRDRTSADGNTGLPVGMHSHTPNILNAAQTTWLTNHLNAFNSALNGANFADPVLGYAPYIDVQSFIDNWWFVEVLKQIDGYRLSTYFYKDRGGRIFAAPVWDYNLSLGNADYLAGDQYAGWYWNQTDTYWWARLRQDPNYELQNWDRYWEMRRSIFQTGSILAYIDQLKSEVLNGITAPVGNNMSLASGQPSTNENAAMRHYRKYQVLGTYLWPNAGGNPSGAATLNPRPWQVNTTYQAEVDWMKGWLSQRLNWIDDQNFSGAVIYRPPSLSLAGGSVPAGTQISIARYTGTAPVGYSYASGGTIYYTLDGSDPRGAPQTVVENVLLSGTGNSCKWLVPAAGNGGFTLTAGAGVSQWTNYTDPPNIANWTTSVTGVGYDTATDYDSLIGAGSDTQAQMMGVNPTCYVRVPFTISALATIDAIDTLKLSMKYDDGFRAYINGVLVAGRNDSDPSLTTDPSTAQANQIHDDAQALVYEDIDITAAGKTALRAGTNVLAIHGMNSPSTSSDLLFVPRLTWSPTGSGGGGAGQVYTGPITLNSSATVKTRLFANGVWSPLNEASYVVNAVPASASNLVIAEVHYQPAEPSPAELAAGYGSSDFEFVEILNVSAQNVDLTNCRFSDGITYAFGNADPVALTLAPGARALVVENLTAFEMRYGVNPALKILGQYTGNLRNEGETVTLLAANEAVIASFTYQPVEPWPADSAGAGFSLVLNNPAAGVNYDVAGAWRSSAQAGGSPGASNSSPFTGSIAGDTDGDGLSDFVEYAMGTSWGNTSSVPVMQHSFVTDPPGAPAGTYLLFQFRRNLAADGLMLVPEQSADLALWSSAGIVYVSTVNQGDGTALITCRSAAPVSGSGIRSYMRVLVSPVP